jgi:predicted ester cyclase
MSSVESLRGVVRRLADTFNDPASVGNYLTLIFRMITTFHDFPPNQPANKEGFRQFIYLLWKAFPDITITFDDIVIEGNKVACRYNLSGTHKGQFEGLRPTDKQFRVNGMTVFSFRDAKVIERWNVVDMKSLIEVIPNPEPCLSFALINTEGKLTNLMF